MPELDLGKQDELEEGESEEKPARKFGLHKKEQAAKKDEQESKGSGEQKDKKHYLSRRTRQQ